MSLFSTLLAMVAVTTFVSMLLFVLFGQVTVRKLRKNPKTKNELGIEFVSGWDIINVAQAISIPRSIMKKFNKTQLSFLYANADLLYKYTNTFDRFIARLFYWLFMIAGLSGAFLVLLNALSVFD